MSTAPEPIKGPVLTMLTALAIQNAKPRDEPYMLTDGNGLHLEVTPNGSKLWRLRYRFGGKQNRISLGSYPEVSLASARTKRDDARKLVADGKDPSQQRKQDRLTAAVAARNTFRAVAEEVLTGLAETNSAKRTMEKNRWLLLDLAAPLAGRPIADVTPAEVLVNPEEGGEEWPSRDRQTASRSYWQGFSAGNCHAPCNVRPHLCASRRAHGACGYAPRRHYRRTQAWGADGCDRSIRRLAHHTSSPSAHGTHHVETRRGPLHAPLRNRLAFCRLAHLSRADENAAAA